MKKEMEYEDAPSGSVTLYNYKEPFMKFEKGYGYYGVLLFDAKSDKVQCHLCGTWEHSVAHHLKKEHNITAAQYKEVVGLNKKTALISESYRARLIKAHTEKSTSNLRKGTKMSEETKQKIKDTLIENGKRMENKNKYGTCPYQLLDRLSKKHKELGRTPSRREIPALYKNCIKVYGSFEKACELANVPYRPVGVDKDNHRTKYTEEYIIKFFKEYFENYNKWPRQVDMPDGIYEAIRKRYDKKQIIKKAVLLSPYYIPVSRIKYTDEELIDFLVRFKNINGRNPSYSDARRKLIPHLSRYSYRFGSWQKALELAFNNQQNETNTQ